MILFFMIGYLYVRTTTPITIETTTEATIDHVSITSKSFLIDDLINLRTTPPLRNHNFTSDLNTTTNIYLKNYSNITYITNKPTITSITSSSIINENLSTHLLFPTSSTSKVVNLTTTSSLLNTNISDFSVTIVTKTTPSIMRTTPPIIIIDNNNLSTEITTTTLIIPITLTTIYLTTKNIFSDFETSTSKNPMATISFDETSPYFFVTSTPTSDLADPFNREETTIIPQPSTSTTINTVTTTTTNINNTISSININIENESSTQVSTSWTTSLYQLTSSPHESMATSWDENQTTIKSSVETTSTLTFTTNLFPYTLTTPTPISNHLSTNSFSSSSFSSSFSSSLTTQYYQDSNTSILNNNFISNNFNNNADNNSSIFNNYFNNSKIYFFKNSNDVILFNKDDFNKNNNDTDQIDNNFIINLLDSYSLQLKFCKEEKRKEERKDDKEEKEEEEKKEEYVIFEQNYQKNYFSLFLKTIPYNSSFFSLPSNISYIFLKWNSENESKIFPTNLQIHSNVWYQFDWTPLTSTPISSFHSFLLEDNFSVLVSLSALNISSTHLQSSHTFFTSSNFSTKSAPPSFFHSNSLSNQTFILSDSHFIYFLLNLFNQKNHSIKNNYNNSRLVIGTNYKGCLRFGKQFSSLFTSSSSLYVLDSYECCSLFFNDDEDNNYNDNKNNTSNNVCKGIKCPNNSYCVDISDKNNNKYLINYNSSIYNINNNENNKNIDNNNINNSLFLCVCNKGYGGVDCEDVFFSSFSLPSSPIYSSSSSPQPSSKFLTPLLPPSYSGLSREGVIGLSLGLIFFFLVLPFFIGMIFLIKKIKTRRAKHGVYSPSNAENFEATMDFSQTLKVPPEERLI